MPGAHWVRAALQVNPYAYQGRNSPSTRFASEADYNKALLDKCDELGIELIAITDHWAVDTASGLIQDATARRVVALPGFEANTAEGFHLLVIFEAATAAADVNAAIGACGVTPGCNNGTVGQPFEDILEKMSDRGALVIPAHANVANSGMLTGRQGNPLAKLINHPRLHALGVTPSVAAAQEQEAIIGRRKPFDRKHPLAVIHADDISHPDALQTEGGSTWFKVSTLTVESLKIAVRTPETRIALADPKGETRPLLKEISWVGGFLDGVTIPLSPDLTALIGGRGTGKSTAIESLRYVLGLTPIGVSAKADHNAIVSGVLRSGTVVKLAVEATSPRTQAFTIERSVNNTPVVKDASGTVTSLQPADVIGDVEIFGQHELAELASDSAKVASMLHRFQGNGDLSAEHKATLATLKESRDKLARAEKDNAELEEELADIPRLEEQVRQFQETDVPTRLSEVTRMNQDEAVFSEGRSRVADAKSTLTALTDTQLTAKLGASYDGLEGSPQADTLRVVRSATTTLAETLKALATQAEAAIAAADAAIASAETDWTNAVREQRDDHAEVLRKLVQDGLEPDKYLATAKALEDLKAKEPRLTSIDANIKELVASRKTLLQELAEHENKRVEALHDAIRTANAATGGVVIVKPIAAQDRRHVKSLIEGAVSGQRTQIMAAVDAEGFSTRAFVEAARKGEAELTAKFSIRGAQARGVVDAGEALFRQIEELSVGNAVEVQLDIGAGTGTREFKKMDDLSKGQRATALLLLLLGASRTPLVIDQPEDDLDNRFVYDGIVKNLRELKGKRQIIASTHNANVPVLGDAELIVALEGSGQNGKPVEGGIGSLDDATIRALAESILEGGPAAFNARQHLYGF
ncbi:TrlF family AAA-like ATPase [Mycolicibacterium fortuitum]|uniref:TrlF family AAA-like ATPase n=1 Tax=Mycolicibacterium fortuitum TaxID=1766 RepID=UPI001AEF4E8D|nr:AAA family ATPase [Mycolicibacterium fortuitum]MBP3083815.1 AAA family ATPase [Mycolicibacterium fortuitum]